MASLHATTGSLMPRRALLSLLAVTALWGMNFSVSKLGVARLDPWLLAGTRFLLCALPLMFFVRRPAIAWRWLLVYGLAFGVGTWGLMTLALSVNLAPALGAWILQASAFGTPLLASLWLREPWLPRQRLGALVAGVGFAVMLGASGLGQASLGAIAALGAAASLSFANVVVRRSGTRPGEVVALLVWSSPFSALVLLVIGAVQGSIEVLLSLPAQLTDPLTAAAVLFQVYPVTIVGYWVWNRGLLEQGAAAVAPLALLVPVWAALFAGVLFGTLPTPLQVLGMAFIGAGLLVNAGLLRLPRFTVGSAS